MQVIKMISYRRLQPCLGREPEWGEDKGEFCTRVWIIQKVFIFLIFENLDHIQRCFCSRVIYIFCYESQSKLLLNDYGGRGGGGGGGGWACPASTRQIYLGYKMDLINLSENVHMTKNLCARMSRMIELGSGSDIEY